MSDCPYHLTPEDTGERRRRTDPPDPPRGHLREAVKDLLFSGGFTPIQSVGAGTTRAFSFAPDSRISSDRGTRLVWRRAISPVQQNAFPAFAAKRSYQRRH